MFIVKNNLTFNTEQSNSSCEKLFILLFCGTNSSTPRQHDKKEDTADIKACQVSANQEDKINKKSLTT